MSRLRDSDGSALITAIALLAVMLIGGIGVMTVSDGQQHQAGQTRLREAAFTITEGALDAQVTRLSINWPMSVATAYPVSCSPLTAALSARCPDAGALRATFNTRDDTNPRCGGDGAQWTTSVRDNGGTATTTYQTTVVAAQPSYDANGDGQMWVRSEGRAGCRLRTITTLVRANEVSLGFPRVTLSANWLSTTNNGRKVIIDTVGSYAQPASVRPDVATAQPAPVRLRCDSPAPTPCLNVDTSKGQISGSTAQIGPMQSPAMNDDDLAMFKARARALGTYFAAGSCPASLTGVAIFIEDATGCPVYDGGNSALALGMTVVARGTLSLGGNRAYYGVLYARNEQRTTGVVVSLQGTSLVQGMLIVDGLGGVSAGSSGTNVVFDPRAGALVRGLGDAAPVPGTWREIAPNE